MANFSTPSAGRGSRFKHFYDKKSFFNRPDDYIEKMITTCFGTKGFHKIKYQKNKMVEGQFDDEEKKSFYNRPDNYIRKMKETSFGTGGLHNIKWQKNRQILDDKKIERQFDDTEKKNANKSQMLRENVSEKENLMDERKAGKPVNSLGRGKCLCKDLCLARFLFKLWQGKGCRRLKI